MAFDLSMNDNITRRTTRKNQKFLTSSLDSLSENRQSLDDSLYSVPDLSIRAGNLQIQELKENIEKLEGELQSSHQEIELLLSENCKLKSYIEELEKKNERYKYLNSTPVSCRRSKNKGKRLNPKKNFSSSQDNLSQICNSKVPKKDNSNPEEQIESSKKINKSDLHKECGINEIDKENERNLNAINSHVDATGSAIGRKKKNLIFGTQQCIGLASKLTYSRHNTAYEEYIIESTTKPNALTEEFIKCCKNARVDPTDKVILCLGENDCNPTKLGIDICTILNIFGSHVEIIIISIIKNYYLNEIKLNDLLKFVIIIKILTLLN